MFRKFFSSNNFVAAAANNSLSSSSAALCSKAASLFSSAAALNLAAHPSQVSIARFCSTSSSAPAAAASTSSSSSNSNNRGSFSRSSSGNQRNFNRGGQRQQQQQQFNSGGRSMQQRQQKEPVHATCEFYDVRDSPKEGRMLRLSFRANADGGRNNNFNRGGNNNNNNNNNANMRACSATILPQLGPRLQDVHDPTPQFDNAGRVGIRLRSQELAEILMWLEGRKKGDSVNVGSSNTRVEVKRHDTGVTTLSITARKLNGEMGEPMAYTLQPHQLVQFRTFIQESLFAYWDFPAF